MTNHELTPEDAEALMNTANRIIKGEEARPVDTIRIEPDWEGLAAWSATAFVQHAYDEFATAPMRSFLEMVRYLAVKDPEALQRIINRFPPEPKVSITEEDGA